MLNPQVTKFYVQLVEDTMLVGDRLAPQIEQAATMLANALIAGKTIYTCGQSNAGLISQILSDNLALGTRIERPGFPSINLNQLTQNHSTERRFAPMLLTHAHQSDLLVIISRGGSDDDLVRSAEVAMDLGMSMILFAHKSDAILMESLGYGDLCIDMSQFDESLLSTLQFQAVECLCSLIDQIILGGS